MAIGNNMASVASQKEYIAPELEEMILRSSVLWSLMKEDTPEDAVSTRPFRIPIETGTTGIFSVGATFDGASLGLGAGPQQVPGYLSCVGFVLASQYTALSAWANDSKEKSVTNYVTETEKTHAKDLAAHFDIQCLQAGDNVADYAVSVGTSSITVHQANLFMNLEYVDLWSAVGGTFLGTVQIQTADSATTTLYLTQAVPAGFAAGMPIMFHGASGQANTGLLGIRAWQQAGNVGQFMGINKLTYPGLFSTPSINLGGKALTPAIIRALEAQQALALGEENEDEDSIAHCGPDGRLAWEENALLVQTVQQQAVTGDESVDMLKRKAPTMMAGRRLVMNPRAYPGFVDFLKMKYWKRAQTRAVSEYEVAGQTLFPAYGGDGGVATSMLFYSVALFQIYNPQPRRGAYIQNFAIPNNIPLTYGNNI